MLLSFYFLHCGYNLIIPKKVFNKNLIFIFSVIWTQAGYSVSVDSTLLNESSVNASNMYLTDALATGSSLYNGIEHPGYLRSIKGSAYLDSEEFSQGRVKFDGVWYTIPMLYDLYAEKLVITHLSRNHRMSLINEKIEQFVIHGHRFINFRSTESQQFVPKGLCEVVYEGDSISLYAKKRRHLNERPTMYGLERDFTSFDQYYLFMDGSYHLIKSKRDMFALMGSRRREVATELRKNKIKFKRDRERALITASKIYDEKTL